MSIFVLIPVKQPKSAKSRMSQILSGQERAQLARAMFEDVVRAVEGVHISVAVVTNSDEAARRARKCGWRILWESCQISESASVDAASAQLRLGGASAVVRLPADLPWITPSDLEVILADPLPAPFAVLVPSADRMGTNAILRKPPDLFPSRFGHNSFVLHLQEAQRSRAQIRIVENAHIALDLDDERDLRSFLQRPSKTHTYDLLQKLNIEERLAQRDSSA